MSELPLNSDVIDTVPKLVGYALGRLDKLVKRVERIREQEDVSIKTMARLFAVMQECKKQINMFKQVSRLSISLDEIYTKLKYFNNWIKHTEEKVTRLIAEEKELSLLHSKQNTAANDSKAKAVSRSQLILKELGISPWLAWGLIAVVGIVFYLSLIRLLA